MLPGIQAIQDYVIYVTNSSMNLITEESNYLWTQDMNGNR